MLKIQKKLANSFFLLVLAGCGIQTSTESPSVIDVKSDKKVVSAEPVKLSIGAGSAAGAEVVLPADVLPEDSVVSFDRVSQPAAFRALKDSSGNSITTASSAISISAVGPDGNAISKLPRPMQISIPIGSASLGLITLEGVEAKAENLCILLSTEVSQYVWRKSSIFLNETGKVASINSMNFGVFQAAYCGNETLEGFIEAESAGVTEGSAALSLSIDSAVYGYGGKSYCVFVGSQPKNLLASGRSEITVINSVSANVSGKTELLKMSFLLSYIPAEHQAILGIMVLGDGQACSFSAGDKMLRASPFLRGFFMPVTKSELAESKLNGVFGQGRYSLNRYYLDYGVPKEDSAQEVKPGADFKLCVVDEGSSVTRVEINTTLNQNGLFSGQERLVIDTMRPKESLRFYVAENGCQSSALPEFSATNQSFSVDIRSPVQGDSFYVRGVSIKETTLTNQNFGLACLEVYSGNVLTGTMTNIDNKDTKVLNRFVMSQGLDLKALIPWDNSKLNDSSTPLYDFLIIANSSCSSESSSGDGGGQKIPLDNMPLNTSVTL